MKNIDIIIFGGQSNMQGQSEVLSDSRAVDGAYEYKWLTDSVIPLRNPVGEDITYSFTEGVCYRDDRYSWGTDHLTGSACYGHTNLVPEFCRAYISAAGTEVLAVHIAKGSTQIADWLPGTPGYGIIVKKASAAIGKAEAEYCIGRIFFVWLQGESDAILGRSKCYYKEKLVLLNASLKQELHIDRFGIIRVGRFTNDARDDEIITAQDEVCLGNEDFIMLTQSATAFNEMAEYMNPYAAGHFSAKGLEMLGKLAGEKLGKNRMD